MSPAVQVTCSLVLSFAVTAIVLLREVWLARRNRGGGDDRDPRHDPAPQPPPLPPCLVPTEQWRAPVRTRELA